MPLSSDVLTTPRRWPIRVATTVITTAIVILVLAAAAGGAWLLLRSAAHNAIDSADRDRAVALAGAMSARGPQAALDLVAEPMSGVDLVRIVGPGGRLLAAQVTRGLEDVPQLPAPAVGTLAQRELKSPSGADLRVTSVGVDVGGVPFAVDVATDTDRYDTVLAAGAILFLSFVPVAGLATAVFVHYAMGRVLRPVESIRSRVAEISASGRGERVPVPEAEDEIARLARTMNAMLARLEATRTAQVAFVGDASHELRSPLSTLSTLLELSSTSGTPVDVETVDELLLPEVQRMRSIVEDLLLLAKNDERGVPMRWEDVDLDDIVLSEAARLRGLDGQSSQGGQGSQGDRDGLDVLGAVEPARLVGDPDALLRVVRNLVDNARRHARSAVSIGLTVDRSTPAEPRAVITVDDDGEGVPPDQRDTVFDRFARLDADRARGKGGSGLGLAIVAEITRSHGGSVRVEDAPAGGARFVVELPVEALDDLGD
ncbi:HAMP domain-containing sensor histidine kinase [Rhodococcus sp. IEGM 1408]|uniref:sensor histidine kinase n=1 Tax=Rhodococcus sp. IEGM 1408 TaxID=3082220 RepID=UPI002955240F|nr:HAMP domain-containing sensor histidine kinase [Rhodococcus sp. IEGM 1408]MDV7999811.1 HAMP domain-containing sensor histidine kinase [Rhodococcus sp. IEGM 1408]